MPATKVVLYREADGTVPLIEFLRQRRVPPAVRMKFIAYLERLEQEGHELRRPAADFLQDGIYELRIRHQSVNYRILYFFHGQIAAVAAHAITKEDRVPEKDIAIALTRRQRFLADPDTHTSQERIEDEAR